MKYYKKQLIKNYFREIILESKEFYSDKKFNSQGDFFEFKIFS